MANIFTIILAIITLITGIIWFIEYFKLIPICFHFFKRMKYNLYQIDTTSAMIDNQAKSYYSISWIKNCASIFPALFLVFIFRSFIFEPFKIPSESMTPTLLVGDFILVNKFCYGIKNPITQTTLIKTSLPKRGDIVVFKYPLNPKLDYIKRVIGLPGDKVIYNPISKLITIQAKDIFIENCTHKEVLSNKFIKQLDNIKVNNIKNNVNYLVNKELSNITLQSSNKINNLIDKYDCLSASMPEWLIPQGKYFVMGDNRDNSSDSRYWGFVPEKNLVGKAIAIWMSFDNQKNTWLPNIRLNRIGKIK